MRYRVGTRGSKLALAQTKQVIEKLKSAFPEDEFDVVIIKTTGDMDQKSRLDQIGSKGIFVKEIEEELLEEKIHLAVHSMKDMPDTTADGLIFAKAWKREDPRDVLVLPEGVAELDFSKPVGCSSRRRMLQFQAMYPEATFAPIRGNVYTRLAKVDSGEYAATILAAAGLKRLGLEQRISRYFSVEEMIPAAGQGVLALQGRAGEDYGFLRGFCSEESHVTSVCERAFIRELDGGCSSPIAAHAVVKGDTVVLRGLYYEECSGKAETAVEEAPVSEAEHLGIMLARRLKELCQKQEEK